LNNREYHVITPFSRWKNFRVLEEMLKKQGATWHVMIDDYMPTMILEGVGVGFYKFRPPPPAFFIGHWALNMFLDDQVIYDDDYYLLMTDDDFYEPGFFDKLRQYDDDVIIVSMNRGLDVLTACPDNMKVCYVGLEQLVIKGKILKQYRIDGFYQADGYLILDIWRDYAHAFRFLPEAQCYFNYLPPGRAGRWG